METEGTKSTFVLRIQVSDDASAVHFSGGGFYEGHVHVWAEPAGRRQDQEMGSVSGFGALNSYEAEIDYQVSGCRSDLPASEWARFRVPDDDWQDHFRTEDAHARYDLWRAVGGFTRTEREGLTRTDSPPDVAP